MTSIEFTHASGDCKMTRIIAVANNKGGVGKTTTAGNLAYGLSHILRSNNGSSGKVLVIDLDVQGNQADFFGVRDLIYDPVTNLGGACLSNLINEPDCDLREFVISLDRAGDGYSRPNLFLSPATRELGFAVENLSAVDSIANYQTSISRGRKKLAAVRQLDTLLSSRLQRLTHNFEFIIVDCPPNLDTLKQAVYEFADEVIVPVKTDRLSAIGAQQHTDDIVRMIKEYNLKIKISFIVPTMMRARQVLAEQTLESLSSRYGANRVAMPVPESVYIKEGPAAGGLTVFEYAPKSEPAKAYADLVRRVYYG
jgi:chromosome partitioning protein